MIKSALEGICILVGGALLGTFLGKLIGMEFPNGRVHDLFATEVVAGMNPAHLDLRIIDLTFGGHLHFNMTSVAGVVVAAILVKKIL